MKKIMHIYFFVSVPRNSMYCKEDENYAHIDSKLQDMRKKIKAVLSFITNGRNFTVSKSNLIYWCINILRFVCALFISGGMMKTIEWRPSINLSQPNCGEIIAASFIQLNPPVTCSVLVIKYLTSFVLLPWKAVAKQNLDQDALKQNRKLFFWLFAKINSLFLQNSVKQSCLPVPLPKM